MNSSSLFMDDSIDQVAIIPRVIKYVLRQINFTFKNTSWAVVANAFDPSTPEADTNGSLEFEGLHSQDYTEKRSKIKTNPNNKNKTSKQKEPQLLIFTVSWKIIPTISDEKIQMTF